jgi:hypothetical protein
VPRRIVEQLHAQRALDVEIGMRISYAHPDALENPVSATTRPSRQR